ncbi:MAG: helicase-exonuclease AddAB subunit AddB [Thermoanaerobacteraceae bacterium]|nr:helicase-exonuclease AddAB subunit AddB [Thermoanaerobacteraceae bacterium]
MCVRFIYGRAGKGKTTYCLKDLKKKLCDGGKYPLLMIVPDEYTFETEKNLLDMVERDADMRAQVLSFNRLAIRVFGEVGGTAACNPIKPCSRGILMYKIMDRTKDNLHIFHRSVKYPGFVNEISSIIMELKTYRITPELLDNIINILNNSLLKEKLKEINLIYKNYEHELHKKYIDQEDEMELLIKMLDYSEELRGAEIWIDGFTKFTPQQLKIIEKLIKKAARVNISLCRDTLNDNEFENIELFSPLKNTEEELIKLCHDNDIELENPVDLNEKPAVVLGSPEIKHLEENIFKYPFNIYNGEIQDISILESANLYDEIEGTAKDVLRLVRDGNLRYKDITIALCDINKYAKLTKGIFTEYGIPYFINQKKDISNNPIIVFITSLLQIFTKDWEYEPVFRYLKTGLLNIDYDDICLIENYVIANGIKGNKWFKDNWEYRLSYRFDRMNLTEEEKDTINRINMIKTSITKPLISLHERINKCKVADICKALYEFMVNMGVYDKIEKLVGNYKEIGEADTAEEYSNIWGIVMDVLDQMVEIMGDEVVTLAQFLEVITMGFDSYNIGLIPPAIDQVLISNLNRLKNHNTKVLYIMGANDGIIPSIYKNEGILSDDDRKKLKELGIAIDGDINERIMEEQFIIYKAMTSAKKYLRISYPIADQEGKTMRPSIMISKLKKIFPDIKCEEKIEKPHSSSPVLNCVSSPAPTFYEMVRELKKSSSIKDVNPIWIDVYRWFCSRPEWKERLYKAFEGFNHTYQVFPDKIKRLYGSNITLSISRLERYSGCPFSYFMEYGLKAKERKTYSFEAIDMGTFFHKVLEEFSRGIKNEGLSWREIDREWCSEKVSLIVDDMLKKMPGYILNSSSRYRYISDRFKRVITRAVWTIAEHIKRGSFNPLEYEVGFGGGKRYSPVKIATSSGDVINIIGRIDRVDVMKKDGELYVRIIDYKSGNKGLNLADVYHGLQLQLILYLDVILESVSGDMKLNPAGIFYLKIDEPMIKSKGDLSEEEIEREVLKALKMKGLVLNDSNIIKEMDNTLKSGYSSIIPVYLKNDGSVGRNTHGVTKEQFKLLRDYVKYYIQKLCDDILKGNIEIKPYKNGDMLPCQFCKFSDVCRIDKNFNGYRIINNEKDDVIWDLMERGLKNECCKMD